LTYFGRDIHDGIRLEQVGAGDHPGYLGRQLGPPWAGNWARLADDWRAMVSNWPATFLE
jgi:hypothetical protein